MTLVWGSPWIENEVPKNRSLTMTVYDDLVTDADAGPPQPVADDSSEEIQALPAQQPGRGPLAVARSTL